MCFLQSDFDASDHFLSEATNTRQIGNLEQEMKISLQARYADATLRTGCKCHANDRYGFHIAAILNDIASNRAYTNVMPDWVRE